MPRAKSVPRVTGSVTNEFGQCVSGLGVVAVAAGVLVTGQPLAVAAVLVVVALGVVLTRLDGWRRALGPSLSHCLSCLPRRSLRWLARLSILGTLVAGVLAAWTWLGFRQGAVALEQLSWRGRFFVGGMWTIAVLGLFSVFWWVNPNATAPAGDCLRDFGLAAARAFDAPLDGYGPDPR